MEKYLKEVFRFENKVAIINKNNFGLEKDYNYNFARLWAKVFVFVSGETNIQKIKNDFKKVKYKNSN